MQDTVDGHAERRDGHGEEDGVEEGVEVVEQGADHVEGFAPILGHDGHGEEHHDRGPAEDHAQHHVGQHGEARRAGCADRD